VHLLGNEQYIDSIMHGATIKSMTVKTNINLNKKNGRFEMFVLIQTSQKGTLLLNLPPGKQ